MANQLFTQVPNSKPRTNVFDLSHDVKLSGNMGKLIPTLCMECVPGDKVQLSCESMVRFAPLVAPVMHRFDVSMHYFFVPHRLLWDKFDFWIQGKPNPLTTQQYAFPYFQVDANNYTPLCDYLGIPQPPTGSSEFELISALPFAAYLKVYWEFYRDQNLIDPDIPMPVLIDSDNTADFDEFNVLRNRAWEHDYFTSALPWAQRGDGVDIPLGEVVLKDDWDQNGDGFTPRFVTPLGTAPDGAMSQNVRNNPFPAQMGVGTANAANDNLAYDPHRTLEVEPTTINDLRRAFKLQEFYEKAARGGSRFIEFIKNIFGVTSPDKRLQRPEYITGITSPVMISEVLNTTGTTERPQGDMAGHAVSFSGKNNYGHYYCQEHGYIMGILSVRPKPAYQQGIPKHFLKMTHFTEHFIPQFANIGEQAIALRELYAFQGGPGASTFGYTPRYAEYKFMNSRVCGDFRDTLNFWHAGRIFNASPALNQQFIEMDEGEVRRIFAVEDPETDTLWMHVFHKIKAIRPMPKFGVPSF